MLGEEHKERGSALRHVGMSGCYWSQDTKLSSVSDPGGLLLVLEVYAAHSSSHPEFCAQLWSLAFPLQYEI